MSSVGLVLHSLVTICILINEITCFVWVVQIEVPQTTTWHFKLLDCWFHDCFLEVDENIWWAISQYLWSLICALVYHDKPWVICLKFGKLITLKQLLTDVCEIWHTPRNYKIAVIGKLCLHLLFLSFSSHLLSFPPLQGGLLQPHHFLILQLPTLLGPGAVSSP